MFKGIIDRLTTKKKVIKPMFKIPTPSAYRPTSPPPPGSPLEDSNYPDDETLRKNHPAVKDAWAKYQMLIKLHGGLTVEQRQKMKSKRRMVRK